MTIKALYPNSRPSLDLNFARTRALDPRITYTRASTGTFVGSNGLIQSAAVNQARFEHNPLTGESLGLLVEEARTNLALNSDTPQFAAINDDGTTFTDLGLVTTSGPMGPSMIARRIQINKNTGSASIFFENNRLVAGTSSIYIRANKSCTIAYGDENWALPWSLVANQWTRVYGTGPAPSWNAAPRNLKASSVAGSFPIEFDFFGVQREEGSFPTSYIPTVASTVTRAADVASITGANFSSWYNQNEGTIFAQGITTNNSAYLYDFSISPADGSQRIYTIGSVSGLISASSNLQVSYTYSANRKTAFAFNSSGLAFGLNGAVFNNAVLLTSPSLIEAVAIGARFNNIGQAGLISRLTYYPVRLPDAQLITLTQ